MANLSSPIITLPLFLLALTLSYFVYRLPKQSIPYPFVSWSSLCLPFLVYLSFPWFLIVGGGPYFEKIRRNFDPFLFTSLTNFAYLAGVLLFLGFFLFFQKAPLGREIWKWGNKPYLSDLLFGLSTWPLAFLTMSLWTESIESLMLYVFPNYVFEQQVAVLYLEHARENSFAFLLACILTIVLAPFVEELLFRGILQNFCKRYLSCYSALGVTALFFASFHYSFAQGLSNLSIVTSLFIFALFLGTIYEKRGSLLSSIALHALFNAVSVIYLTFFQEAS